MKTNFPKQQLEYFPFATERYSVLKSFDDKSFYFAFAISFGFFILIILCYMRKSQLYNQKGYLKIEKNELRHLIEDMQDRPGKQFTKSRHNKRLLSLLTDNEDCDEIKITDRKNNNSHQKKSSRDNKMKYNSELQDQQLSPSKIENIIKPAEISLSIDNAHKWSINNQNEQKNNQHVEILFESKNNNNQKSRSRLLNQEQISNVITALPSPLSKKESEKQQMIGVDKNNEQNYNINSVNIISRNCSLVNSFTSIPHSQRFQSTANTTSITPCSMNSSSIQPPQQNQKFIDSFSSVVVVQEKKFMNSNRFDKSKEQSNEKPIQLQQKSIAEYFSKSNETNLLPIQKIKSPSNQQDDIDKKNAQYAHELEEQMNKQDEHNLDLSFHRVVDLKESTYWQRFRKNWKRLFLRHSILYNTIKQDAILFPRVLKILIISIFINLKFFAGTLIQIYFFNQEVHRDDHVMYQEKIAPSDKINIFLIEVGINAVLSLGFISVMIIFAYVAKADKDIIFINMNNQQLLRNLQDIQSGQSYKLLCGLVVSFIVGSITFLQVTSFVQEIQYDFIERWYTIDIIILTFIFNIFDLVYLTALALIKAAAKKSARCHIFYNYMIKKLSWWSL